MSAGRISAIILVIMLLGLSAGCLTYSYGDAVYRDEALHMKVMNSGEPQKVVLQVTVFNTTDFQQTEIFKHVQYYDLERGENEFVVPVRLEPGSYKLYLYVMVDGERTNLEIRDIEV